jgi:hypothetical protein
VPVDTQKNPVIIITYFYGNMREVSGKMSKTSHLVTCLLGRISTGKASAQLKIGTDT